MGGGGRTCSGIRVLSMKSTGEWVSSLDVSFVAIPLSAQGSRGMHWGKRGYGDPWEDVDDFITGSCILLSLPLV